MQIAARNDSIAYQLTLIKDKLKTLKKANKALLKRQRAKRICIQKGGTYTKDVAEVLITKKEVKKSKQQKMSLEGEDAKARPVTQQRCGNCGKTSYNIQTC